MEPKSMFDLSGQVAIVTGSTKGIGKAIAQQMAAHGANVVISSGKAEACEEVTADINANWARGGEAISVPCNVGYKDQCQELVDATMAKWGRIDTLVCNAAANPYYGPLAEITDEAFNKIMTVNVLSNVWLSGMVCPQMVEQGGGNLIIISSTGGTRGDAKIGAYCLSKAADMQLVRNLTTEWAHHNIRANCLAPALVKTDFARALWENEERHSLALRSYPLGRIGEPDDIAGMAVTLASKAGRWFCGQTVLCDGGSSASIGKFFD